MNIAFKAIKIESHDIKTLPLAILRPFVIHAGVIPQPGSFKSIDIF